jgi:formylglycine-generating enzyme required for sulfatase activity
VRPTTSTPTSTPTPTDAGLPDASAELPREVDDMLLVPGGTFTMGADTGGEEDEHPAHQVTLAPFYLDRTEVTNEAYNECVQAKVCKPPADVTRNIQMFRRPKQPVVGVSWQDAKTFCEWKKKRLPREAEFERAVRGDDGRRFPWGNEPPTKERTVFGRVLGAEATDEVGSHPTGRGPYGHDDLAGNAWEWMEDEYDPFAYKRPTASEGRPGTCKEILEAQDKLRREGRQGYTGSNPIPTECEHSIRGGAFNYDGPGLRSTNRVHHPGYFRIVMLGFRCAKDATH